MEDVILQGVSEVATDVCNNIIQSLSFDRTIIGEIAEVDKDNDRYLISYDGLKFYVNCTDNYTKGTSVYVLIPDGDFSNDKVILSKHTNKQTTPIEVDKGFGSRVECPIEREGSMFYLPYISTFAPPKYLGVKFSLNRTDVEVPQDKNFTVSISFGTKGEEKQWEINSSSLLGNFDNIVENFYFYCVSEEQAFQIEEYTANISLYFGKDKNGTKQWLKLVSVEYFILADQPTLGTVGISTVTNPISFASGRTNLFLEYMSADGTFYTYQNPKEDVNIKYYRYAPSADSAYKEIEPDELWNAEVDVDYNYSFETYKVELIDNEETYGGILSIKNTDASTNTTINTVLSDGIILTCSDSGAYNYYSSTGVLLNDGEAMVNRTITATTADGILLTDAEIKKVNWIVPVKNTIINKQNDSEPGVLVYRINRTYLPGVTDNNTITCEVEFNNGEIRRNSITLRGGEGSTAGTEYAFNIDFVGNKNYLKWGKADDSVMVAATLLRLDGGPVPEEYTVSWGWVESDLAQTQFVSLDTITGLSNKLICKNVSEIGNISYNYLNLVLKATVSIQREENVTTTLTAYLPIPFASEDNYYLVGPTYIIYGNDKTAIEAMSRTPYEIYKLGSDEKVENISTSIQSNISPLPILKNNTLQPLDVYSDNTPLFTVVVQGDGIIWQQPVFCIWNKYENDVINKWDGLTNSFLETGGILTPQLVVGKKDINNIFSGIIAGSWDSTDEQGLYGFTRIKDDNIWKSTLRFFLTNEGRFFVGNTSTSFLGYNLPSNFKTYLDDSINTVNKMILKGAYYQFFSNDYIKKANLILDDTSTTQPFTDLTGVSIYSTVEPRNGIYQTNNDKMVIVNGFVSKDYFANGLPIAVISKQAKQFAALRIESRATGDGTKENDTDAHLVLAALQNKKLTVVDQDTNTFVNSKKGASIVIRGSGIIDFYSGKDFNCTFFDEYTDTDKQYTFLSMQYTTTNNQKLYTSLITLLDYGKSAGDLGIALGGQDTSSTYWNIDSDDRSDGRIMFRGGTVKMGNRIWRGMFYQGSWTYSITKGGTTTKTNYTATAKGINVDTSFGLFRNGAKFNANPDQDDPTVFRGHFNVTTGGGILGGKWYYAALTLKDGAYGTDCPNLLEIATASTTSDIRLKHSIEEYSDKYDLLFDSLRPVTYVYNKTESQRRHCGFIANEIEASLAEIGISNQDFAGLDILGYSENGDNTEKIRALKYDEFISLNTWQIQKLKARVDELEKELKELKQL